MGHEFPSTNLPEQKIPTQENIDPTSMEEKLNTVIENIRDEQLLEGENLCMTVGIELDNPSGYISTDNLGLSLKEHKYIGANYDAQPNPATNYYPEKEESFSYISLAGEGKTIGQIVNEQVIEKLKGKIQDGQTIKDFNVRVWVENEAGVERDLT